MTLKILIIVSVSVSVCVCGWGGGGGGWREGGNMVLDIILDEHFP